MKKKEDLGICFQAIFKKCYTTPDGGWCVSFDVSEQETAHLMQLASLRGKLFQLAAIPIDDIDNFLGE